MAVNFICTPYAEIGSQRCWLNKTQAKQFDVKPGDFVKINANVNNKRDVICKVFIQDPDVKESNDIPGDDTVSVRSDSQELYVKKLDTSYVNELNVTIVLSTFDDVIKYKNNSHLFTRYVFEILKQFGFTAKSTVNCFRHVVGKRLNLVKIIINEIDDEHKNNVLLLANKSTVMITSFYDEAMYELLHGEKPNLDMIGFERPYKSLQKFVTVLKESHLNSIAILLTGLSGSGKTSLIEKLIYDNKIHLLRISATDIYSGLYPGESEEYLQNVFSKAKIHSKYIFTVLFFDDVDCIASQSKTSSGSRVISHLKALLEQIHSEKNILVIGATSKASAVDPSLIGPCKFDCEVHIGPLSVLDRKDILQKMLHSHVESNFNYQELAEQTVGFNRGDLIQFFQNFSLHAFADRQGISMDELKKSLLDFQPSIKKANEFILEEVESVDWSEIGGMEEVKESIQKIIKLIFKDRLRQFDLSRPRQYGILLYGPPGCCKTRLVKALANSVNAAFFSLTSANVYSPYVGDSEKAIAEVFHSAHSWSSSIIFFDELDAIVGSRHESNKGNVHEKVLSTLLNEMDGIGFLHKGSQIIESSSDEQGTEQDSQLNANRMTDTNPVLLVIAATNRPDLIDDALLRPGRFDRKIYIPPPDFQSRLSILKLYTEAFPLCEVDLTKLSEITDKYTGADLELLCRQAAFLSIRQNGVEVEAITNEHFVQALSIIKPSIDEEQLKFYENYEKNKETTKRF